MFAKGLELSSPFFYLLHMHWARTMRASIELIHTKKSKGKHLPWQALVMSFYLETEGDMILQFMRTTIIK